MRFPSVPVCLQSVLVLIAAGCSVSDEVADAGLVRFDDVFITDERLRLQVNDDDPVGSVADLVHWQDQLVVADGLGSNVKVFDATGRLTMTIGRAGEGPGEFRSPMALDVLDDGRLAVLDLRRVQVNFFRKDGGFDGSIGVGVARTGGMRAIRDGSALLVSSRVMNQEAENVSDESLHVFRIDGHREHSFGREPQPKARTETAFLTTIMEVVGDSLVLWGVRSRPEIYVTSLAGEVLDTITLSAIEEPDWEGSPSGPQAIYDWSTNYEWLVDIIPADDFVALRFHGGDGRRGTEWSRYVLVGEDWTREYVTGRTDAVIHSIRDGRAYGATIGDDGETYLRTYEVNSPF